MRACKLLKEDAGREWVNFFSGTEGGGCNFHIKNELKSEIINDKKKVCNKQKYFSLS